MNKKQRILLWCLAVIQVVMVLFPPYRYGSSGGNYHFVFGPYMNAGALDLYVYLIQWTVMITLGFLAYHLLRDS